MADITVPQQGKIDIHHQSEAYRNSMEHFQADNSVLPENKQLILDFLYDAEIGKTIKKGQKKKLGPARCQKYLFALRQISVWFNKPFKEVNQKDMELFVRNLDAGIYKPKNKPRYSDESIADYKKVIKKFYKWINGGYQFPALVEWIESFVRQKDVPSLNRAEVDKMVSFARNNRDKTAIMFLYDSGARVEEFMNIRLKHVAKQEDYYQTRIEFSKTKPRTISVPMCTEFLDKWLYEHPLKDNPEAQLFPYASYATVKSFLYRLSMKALNKRVTPHLFRHSSATFYCNTLNRFQLCYRYGWAMSSDMPDRYIDREGIHEKETAKKIQGAELSVLKERNQQLTEDVRFLRSQCNKLEAQMRERENQEKVINPALDELTKDKETIRKMVKIMSDKNLLKKFAEL